MMYLSVYTRTYSDFEEFQLKGQSSSFSFYMVSSTCIFLLASYVR
jgi:hypothetical protein